jgi:hypothetical protein
LFVEHALSAVTALVPSKRNRAKLSIAAHAKPEAQLVGFAQEFVILIGGRDGRSPSDDLTAAPELWRRSRVRAVTDDRAPCFWPSSRGEHGFEEICQRDGRLRK